MTEGGGGLCCSRFDLTECFLVTSERTWGKSGASHYSYLQLISQMQQDTAQQRAAPAPILTAPWDPPAESCHLRCIGFLCSSSRPRLLSGSPGTENGQIELNILCSGPDELWTITTSLIRAKMEVHVWKGDAVGDGWCHRGGATKSATALKSE